MFLMKYKRQMLFWCLLSFGLCLSRLIDNVLHFDALRILINIFMVLTLSFLLYAVSYPFVSLFGRLRASKMKCLSLLLLICVAVFIVAPSYDASANAKRAAKQILIGVGGFLLGVSFENKVEEVLVSVEDAAYDAVYGTAEKIYETIMHRCPKCGTPGAKAYHSGSGAVNCPAYSSSGGSSSGGSSSGGSSSSGYSHKDSDSEY